MKPELSPIERGALPLVQCPEDVWEQINSKPRGYNWSWIAAAAALILGGTLWFLSQPKWIESGRIQIGTIGTVDVEPGSRVRILKASPTEHRLELAQGAIEAEINAPPRIFFVNTPATTAIDLGCKYRMESDAEGNGLLHVTGGWVAMGDSLVPAGASCSIHAKRGPALPYFDDAPLTVKVGADRFGVNGQEFLEAMLRDARVRDTLTLWHVLKKVRGTDRERVLDRMTALTPLPAGITREAVLTLDEDSLRKYREELAWTW